MKGTRVFVAVITASLLALAAVAPAAAQNYSCVGWFASTNAQEDGRTFGAEISDLAREGAFGSSVVAPFAHLPLEFCQD